MSVVTEARVLLQKSLEGVAYIGYRNNGGVFIKTYGLPESNYILIKKAIKVLTFKKKVKPVVVPPSFTMRGRCEKRVA